MKVLVINCGSSSLKFQLIDSVTEDVLAKGLCERIAIDGSRLVYQPKGGEKTKTESPMPTHTEAIAMVLNALTDPERGVIKDMSEIDAVGHRIVHGGESFSEATVLNDEVIKAIEACSDLAPLHNPANLIGINACKALMPDTPMVAVFDTAFHQTMPEEAYLYGLPKEYYEKYKVRRYGFHGTSHSYVSKKAAQLLNKPYDQVKTIVCHLGNGASCCAVKYGKSVDTSMGLTPLEGLIMGTRSGDIDPAIIEFIAKKEGLSLGDFMDLERDSLAKKPEALLTMKVFAYRVAKYIGAYAAAMNGVDAIAFTAGLGENNKYVREDICAYLGYLGVKLDPELNAKRGEDLIVSTPDSRTAIMVIPTNEELAIARETVALVG